MTNIQLCAGIGGGEGWVTRSYLPLALIKIMKLNIDLFENFINYNFDFSFHFLPLKKPTNFLPFLSHLPWPLYPLSPRFLLNCVVNLTPPEIWGVACNGLASLQRGGGGCIHTPILNQDKLDITTWFPCCQTFQHIWAQNRI